jgi:hypothetical protein
VVFSRYKRGQVKAVSSIADRAVEAFEANPRPIRVIATAMGLSPRQLRNLLYRRGYDAQVRNELALAVCPKGSEGPPEAEGRVGGRKREPQEETMAHKERRERLFGMVHVLALRAIERSPDERQAFITNEVEEIRREYARDYGQSPISEQITERMVRWTEAMVQILEEAGTIGQA